MVYDNIGAAGLYIFSRAKPTLRQPLSDTRESSEKTVPTSLPTVPSFPRRRESRPSAFRNIQRLPQYGLCLRIWFTTISVAAGLYIFSRAKPTLRQPIADTRKSSEKTHSTSLPASPSFPRRRESDLRFSEISNDYCSVGCVHGYGLRQYQLRRVSYIFSRAKPTLRQSLEDTRKSSEKTVPHPCLLFRHSRAGGNPDL